VAEEETGGSPLLIGVALLGAPVFIVVLLLILLGGGATPPPSPCGSGAGGSSPGVGTLRVAGIPANYVPLIQKAGTVCPEFPAPVIAAQLDQESGFSDPTSSTGAQGPAQFEPTSWVTWGNGGNVHDPVAAIDAQARFDCALAGQVKTAQAAGQIHSSASVTEMALGGYNAGFAAVVASGGIPQNSQTMAYVPRIMTLARTTFSDAGTITAPGATPPPPADGGGTGTQASAGCGGVGGQVAVHQVDYPVPGGGTQPADLYVPAGAGPGTPPRPIIVMAHGGGYVAGDRSELGDAAKAAAAHGYQVLNISYDLSAPRWPRQVQQVDAAIDYVRAQGTGQGIDPARVALLGDSAGAGLVLDAGLLGDHHGVQAVVSWSGPADFTSLLAQATPGDTYQQASAVVDPSLFLGCPMVLCPDLWRQASPALSVTAGAPPTMLVNSDHELVPVAQVGEMTAARWRRRPHGDATPCCPRWREHAPGTGRGPNPPGPRREATPAGPGVPQRRGVRGRVPGPHHHPQARRRGSGADVVPAVVDARRSHRPADGPVGGVGSAAPGWGHRDGHLVAGSLRPPTGCADERGGRPPAPVQTRPARRHPGSTEIHPHPTAVVGSAADLTPG